MLRIIASTQQHGFMHAGVITAAPDSACGYTAFSVMPDDAAAVAVDLQANHVGAAQNGGWQGERATSPAGESAEIIAAGALFWSPSSLAMTPVSAPGALATK